MKIKKLNRYLIGFVFVLNQLVGQFAFSANLDDLSVRSKAYQSAMFVYLKGNNGSEMMRIISEADPAEQITAKLKTAHIDLTTNPNGRTGEARATILKIITEEYLRVKTTEVHQLIEVVRQNSAENPELSQSLVQSELAELTALLNILSTYNASANVRTALTGVLVTLAAGVATLVLFVLAPVVGMAAIVVLPAMYIAGAITAVSAVTTVLTGLYSLMPAMGDSVQIRSLYQKLSLYRDQISKLKVQAEVKINTKNVLVLP